MSLLEMSVPASLFILVVVCVRAMLLHKVPKMTFIILWGVALWLLLVPVSVQSPFSIFTAVNDLDRMFTVQESISLAQSLPTSNGGTFKVPLLTDRITTPALPLELMASISSFVVVWFIGFTLCTLSFVIPHVRYRKDYRMSMPIENDFIQKWHKFNPLWRKVQIRKSDKILTPLTYGIFRSVILLPKHIDYTDEKQLGLILTHEYIHIKRFDTLKKWLLAASLCVHWFNPFVWMMYILANRDIELACDEAVIWASGESMKPAYAMALIQLEEKKSGLTSIVSHFSKNAIEERIISIMKIKKFSIVAKLLAIVIVSGAVTIFATSALDKTEAALGAAKALTEIYQGDATNALMPIDLTFTQADVPQLMDQLNTSKVKAVYVDNEMALRVTKDNAILISKDHGATWKKVGADNVDAADFAGWLLRNDPNPGYSMKQLQSRLANGAEVMHVAFENGKEIYAVVDKSGVQLELVQPEKLASILIDGERMMITSKGYPFRISEEMLKSFFDRLVSSSVLTIAQAEQNYMNKVQYFKERDTIFTLTD
ncbi:M56 family metallopeptidase [Paenibacillus filicis]